MKQTIVGLVLVWFGTSLLVGACATTKPQPFTADAIRNADYDSPWAAFGHARLSDGIYREKFNPDSPTEIVIRSDLIVMGDLDGDGVPDAVVLLISSPGGSGTFYDLAAVVNYRGIPKNIDTVPLGDRVKVKAISIQSGTIKVEMLAHGPKDPMCCPTVEVTRTYKLDAYKLARVN